MLLSHKREWNNAICSRTGENRDYHIKSNSERQIYDITYMWNFKKWFKLTYLQNRNRLTDIQSTLTVTRRKSRWGGINQEFGISRNTLLYIKQINNRSYCISQNDIQHSVINHNGKQSKKCSLFWIQKK